MTYRATCYAQEAGGTDVNRCRGAGRPDLPGDGGRLADRYSEAFNRAGLELVPRGGRGVHADHSSGGDDRRATGVPGLERHVCADQPRQLLGGVLCLIGSGDRLIQADDLTGGDRRGTALAWTAGWASLAARRAEGGRVTVPCHGAGLAFWPDGVIRGTSVPKNRMFAKDARR